MAPKNGDKEAGAKPKSWPKLYRTEIAASTSSVVSIVASYPLDSIKTRLQVSNYTNIVACIKYTYSTEGARGFWRGCFAPLASATAVRTASFSAYQKSKYTYSDWIHRMTGISPLVVVNTPGSYPSLLTMTCFAAAGATSGAFVTPLACPFELTKVASQMQILMGSGKLPNVNEEVVKSYQGKGTIRTAMNIVRMKGFKGLYAGFHLHLMRDTLGTAIYFTTYESSKQLMMTSSGSSPTSPLPVAIAGGICGIVSWAMIYPIDSAKSLYQRNVLTHNVDSMERVVVPKIQWFLRENYRGLAVSMLRSCVLNAIFFTTFELIKKQINSMED